MKMVYTHENFFIVSNIHNILEAQDINSFIKNEFSQSAVGEISAFDTWPEVWVFDDTDFTKAAAIITAFQTEPTMPDWVCKNCSESNSPSFELCWNCQQVHS